MIRRTHPFTGRVAALAATVLAVVLFTAGQASAMRPDPADPGVGYKGPSRASMLVVTNNSLSVLEWVFFAAAVIGGLVLGAVLMNLSQRHRVQLAH